ncbi:MAG: acetylxylan esterase [Chthoniobacterales bacterium]
MLAIKRFLVGLFFVTAVIPLHAATSSDGKVPVEYIISVYTDRPEALYHQKEQVTFNIDLQHNSLPANEDVVDWVLTKDGLPLGQQGQIPLKNGKASITGTLEEPGFLQCKVTYKNGKTVVSALAAAGFDLTEIKPSLPVPADFDSFWADQKKKLASVPLKATTTPVPLPPHRDGVEVFEFSADCIGAPSTGYIGKPIGAKPKSLPALLFVPGAGVRSANLDGVAGWSKNGILVAEMNAHGILNGQPSAFYGGLDSGELKDYRTRGRDSRETYYFLGVYLRVLRAIDYLTSQPEWDGKTLIINGVSQGGGLGLMASALDPRVTFSFIAVPGLSDHSGGLLGRIAGWPKVAPILPDGKPDPKVIETLRYFDSANFATRVKTPIYFEVGFIDVICPPTCSYVDYNNLKCPKDIKNFPNFGHDLGPEIWARIKAKTLEHIASQSKATVPVGL